MSDKTQPDVMQAEREGLESTIRSLAESYKSSDDLRGIARQFRLEDVQVNDDGVELTPGGGCGTPALLGFMERVCSENNIRVSAVVHGLSSVRRMTVEPVEEGI